MDTKIFEILFTDILLLIGMKAFPNHQQQNMSAMNSACQDINSGAIRGEITA